MENVASKKEKKKKNLEKGEPSLRGREENSRFCR
jgi:hypothetical protein